MSDGKSQLIHVRSRFCRMALRQGGIAAEDAIAAAEDFIEAERSRYFEWVEKDMNLLDQHIDALHAASEDELAPAFDMAYYKAAQIRDLGGTFDCHIITEIADNLCELLDRLRSAGRRGREAIDTHRAALRMVSTRDFADQPEATGAVLLQGLDQVLGKYPRPAMPGDGEKPQ